ncbi:Zinc finger protein 862 [Merluccius polli]|uniref:Zinc finger protein 862 n=1 Tax=Merluccius polli TaxID=89951 RepID=A0AA47MIC1_MERPO|nr:Zinc finger protein 862 [Merluccius polli]
MKATSGLTFEGVKLSVGKNDDRAVKTAGQTLLSRLRDSLNDRFQDVSEGVLRATMLASFKNWTDRESVETDFGDREIEALCQHFGPVLTSAGVCVEKIPDQWTILKSRIYAQTQTVQTTSWSKVNQRDREQCPDVLDLIDLVLAVPASTADCERGFSTMKQVKTDWRSNLTSSSLSDLMTIQLCSPDVNDFDPSTAIHLWHSDTVRSRRPDYVPEDQEDQDGLPPELLPDGKTGKRRIIIASENPVPGDGASESIIRAVGDLLAKMEKPSGENSSYPGEESLEHWLEHARLMVEESKCSSKEKQRRITSMRTLQSQVVADSKEPRSLTKVPTPETDGEDEVATLRKQVKNLQKQMAGQKSKVSESPATVHRVESSRPAHSDNRKQPSKDSDGNFCYRCGENVHFSAKCHNAENQAKVIQKLIHSLKKAKQGESPVSRPTVCSAKKSVITTLRRDIPHGLIGPSSIVPVKINGQHCDALLDSGSQVTIIFETWYKRHLYDVPIKPVSGLAIWGLSDTSYPYLGYVVVEMEFPAKVTGSKETLSVLALICPSPQSSEKTSVILGTNANLFQRLSRLCKETTGVDLAQTLGIKAKNSIVHTVQPTIEGAEEEVGYVKWMGPGSLTLPPGGECCAICEVELTKPLDQDLLMVEASPTVPLPSGVLLQPMVVPTTAVDEDHLTDLIQKESLKDTVIPVGTVLGQLCYAD